MIELLNFINDDDLSMGVFFLWNTPANIVHYPLFDGLSLLVGWFLVVEPSQANPTQREGLSIQKGAQTR